MDLSLHPGQLEVFKSPQRFKAVVAGRRWGNSRLAVVNLINETSILERNGYDLKFTECWYIAPTYKQAEDIAWRTLLTLAEPIIRKTWANDLTVQFKNGRVIQLKGSDRPDRLRGVGLSHVTLDEYADMHPETWEYIIAPTLADVEGTALFIGTPKGRNHFYELFLRAMIDEEWGTWSYTTLDNPFINPKEVDRARRTQTTQAFKQEFEASFDTLGATVLDPESVLTIGEKEVPEGQIYIAVDPAGYADANKVQRSQLTQLDETAIAVVSVGSEGWHVLDIQHGRWDVRETSVRILRAVQKHRPLAVGIEKGALKNAIAPYLEDQRRRLGISCVFTEVAHGGKSKESRIAWALQARMEHGRLKFVDGDYILPLREQMFDFPSGRRDDMLDALAYIDQLSSTIYGNHEQYEDSWEPLDAAVGI